MANSKAISEWKLCEPAALERAAECLRTLAHPHRLQMIHLLLQRRFTVGELAEACEIASPTASEHLRLMERCGFLQSRREGQRKYYSVVAPYLKDLIRCVEKRFGNQ